MGQYYRCVSIDKKESAGYGGKLAENFWIGNSYMRMVEQALSPGNRWHKTRIVWAGDYMKEGLFLTAKKDKNKTLYEVAKDWPDSLHLQDGPEIKYVVNHTKGLYFAIEDIPQIDNQSWGPLKIHPLPILTNTSNGEGGGDYTGEEDSIGTWAGDVISTEYEEPVGMEKFTEFFTEY